MARVREHAVKLPGQHAADGQIGRQLVLGEESYLAGFQTGPRLTADNFTDEEQLPDVEWVLRRVRVSCPIPHRGELAHAYLVAALLANLLGDAPGGTFVDVSPAA